MDTFDTQRDTAYRAIGRYFVEFSAMVVFMRHVLLFRIARDAGDAWWEKVEIGSLMLGTHTAQPIADAFFAVCRSLGELDESEVAIEKVLRLEVDAEIRRRNLIAHGDWYVQGTLPDQSSDQVATLFRTKPSSVKQPLAERRLTVDELEDYGNAVHSLTDRLATFSVGTIGFRIDSDYELKDQPRARDALELRDGRVVFRR